MLRQSISGADPARVYGELRQIAAAGFGRDKPTLFLTNNRNETPRQIITRCIGRNGIDDSLGSGVNFFHFDCLASEVPRRKSVSRFSLRKNRRLSEASPTPSAEAVGGPHDPCGDRSTDIQD